MIDMCKLCYYLKVVDEHSQVELYDCTCNCGSFPNTYVDFCIRCSHNLVD